MVHQSNQLTRSHSYRWLKRGIAILAALNLALVIFDLTYPSLRSLYVEFIPRLVQIYDPVKGIHPHPETQGYLERIAAVEAQLAQAESQENTQLAPPTEVPALAASLSELRLLSQRLMQHNPFSSQENAILETIQQSLQTRTGMATPSAAFDRFWSQDHLTQANWSTELDFWRQQIRPLINANYYRRVNRFGHPVDYFWLIDLPFMIIFAIDLAVRIRGIRQRDPQLTWFESILRRWYDLFLLFPFWRWLRVIPVTLRLHQVGLINLAPLEAEVQRDFALGFAGELIQVVGVHAIDLSQDAIRRGDVMQWLLYPKLRREYIQVNNQNEISIIVKRITDIIIHQVIPQIQPDLELFLNYTLHHIILEQFPGYTQLRYAPVIGRLPQRTTERITKNLSEGAYQSLVQVWEDPEVAEMTVNLAQNFRDALATELKKKHNIQEIEDLLIDLLEEIKINYVQRLTDVDIEQIVDEAERIYRQREGEARSEI